MLFKIASTLPFGGFEAIGLGDALGDELAVGEADGDAWAETVGLGVTEGVSDVDGEEGSAFPLFPAPQPATASSRDRVPMRLSRFNFFMMDPPGAKKLPRSR
jgi:hypothetical protein